jgi:hypothetical protein
MLKSYRTFQNKLHNPFVICVMKYVENVSVDELRNELYDVDDVHATKRLMVAISYK